MADIPLKLRSSARRNFEISTTFWVRFGKMGHPPVPDFRRLDRASFAWRTATPFTVRDFSRSPGAHWLRLANLRFILKSQGDASFAIRALIAWPGIYHLAGFVGWREEYAGVTGRFIVAPVSPVVHHLSSAGCRRRHA